MEFYELDTEFTFGKYQGKTLEEVFEIEPAFINYCLINHEHFNLSDDILEELKEQNPDFQFSEEALDKREDKFAKWEEGDNDEVDDERFYSEEFESLDEFEEDGVGGSSSKKSSDYDEDDMDEFEDEFDEDYLNEDFDDYGGGDDDDY